jgi:arginase
LELAANDANPDNAERGRHSASIGQAAVIVKTWVARLGEIDGDRAVSGQAEVVSWKAGGEGDPKRERHQARRQAIAILGAPVEAGASVPGAAMGPAMLRTAGISRTLRELGLDVDDRGDLPLPHSLVHAAAPEGKAHRFAHVAAWARLLARETYALMRSGRTPIVLGGDHSLAMGSIGGVARHAAEAGRELFVLWLDAHSDFNTPLTSPSGNMHGMAAAMLCREPGFEDVFGDEPHGFIEPGRLHLFGIRSIDSGERRLLQERGVDVVDMRMLDEHGFAVSIRRIIDRVRARDGLLHVSLDVDFLDPMIAPGVGTAVPGGATYREAHLVMELLYESGLKPSLDLVELNPFLDERGKSALLLVDLTASLMGRQVYAAGRRTDQTGAGSGSS